MNMKFLAKIFFKPLRSLTVYTSIQSGNFRHQSFYSYKMKLHMKMSRHELRHVSRVLASFPLPRSAFELLYWQTKRNSNLQCEFQSCDVHFEFK